ncbi:hypothetical protein NUSPORA_02040 [Nucleospora cyclopteri]
MIILGIEGSANKLGVGILRNKEILSNKRETFVPPKGHGVIPVEAAEHHRAKIFQLIHNSLEEAGVTIEEVDLFCYTRGPGMQQLLTVGCIVARTLSVFYNKPLVPVNHCIAHIEMGRVITNAQNPVILYASGANTQIIAYHDQKYKIFGETLDIAVGNCLDKIARELELDNFPSPGLSIEKKAREGSKYIKLPYSVKGMDMSFSGILSYLKRIKNDHSVEDLCYSLQETMFSILVEATERCLSFVDSNEVLIVGGVGCNLRLQEMLKDMVEQRNGILYAMDERFCIDNGAMIAYTGYLMYKSGVIIEFDQCNVTQRFRTDSVHIKWRD